MEERIKSMSEDEYMKDPKAKTVEGFIEGLTILSKYMTKGVQEGYFCGAEHDEFFIYVDLEACPEDSEDGLMLRRLGFHPSGGDNWGYFT